MPEYRVPVQGALMVEGASPADAARSATVWCPSFGQQVLGQGAQHEIQGGYLETDAHEVTEISGELQEPEDAFDEDNYWEQEYGEFEETHLKTETFWRAPAHFLQGTVLFGVFERFCAAFPDHPHARNTVFYLFSRGGALGYSVLLRCTHFEHDSSEDLRALTEFMDLAQATIGKGGSAILDMLSGETTHLKFSDAREEFITLLQQRSTRTVA
jgi:hypothetical protein